MPQNDEFYAHSPSPSKPGVWHNLVDHLRGVAEKAEKFAVPLNAPDLAYYLGLWHDLGKFNPAWQAYLKESAKGNKPAKKIDHKAAGSLLMTQQKGLATFALLIQGHHGGLRHTPDFKDWFEDRKADPATEEALRTARRLMPDLLPTTKPTYPDRLNGKNTELAREFFLRMLFSALVDADVLDTEAHANSDKVVFRSAPVEMAALWQKFQTHQQAFLQSANDDTPLNRDRQEMYEACLAAAKLPPGLFRLSMPTGGGKTRSALAFALEHARIYDLKRVIIAVPFTTVSEQTASVYHSIFEDADRTGQEFNPIVLEHHSAYAEPKVHDESAIGDFQPHVVWQRLASENWDAPLVVTTTVQLLESLFSNKTGKCRKLHRLAQSVIILDEAQALPPSLLTPILSGLRELSRNYGTTIVFSTATQPAFEVVSGFSDLAATEIIPEAGRFFESLKRVEYDWQYSEQELQWPEIAAMATEQPKSLTVVNTKKDALTLFRLVKELDPQALYLSTDLCSKHRREVVSKVKDRLDKGEPCHLVSTQLIEAGVDLDFPLVLRALAPLDSIIQTAGRCNREGKLTLGRVIIFQPKEGGLPGDEYKRRVNITRKLYGAGYRDLNAPEVAYKYFEQFFQVESTDKHKINELRAGFNYPEVARQFRMIDDNTMNVVVRFGEKAEQARINNILDQLKAGTPASRFLLRELQPYTVAVRVNKATRLIKDRFITQLMPDLGEWLGQYDKDAGLVAEDYQAEDWIF